MKKNTAKMVDLIDQILYNNNYIQRSKTRSAGFAKDCNIRFSILSENQISNFKLNIFSREAF